MKSYWSIPGPSKAPQKPCIAFYKYDGSNVRAEWSKKRGWYKFGTRNQTIDESSALFGPMIPLFLETFGDSIPKILKDNKEYRGVDRIIAFCEYFGPSSLGMWHDWDELHNIGELRLIDINVHKRGFVLPRQFVNDFGHLDQCAEVVYEGNFNKQLIEDVWNGEYPVREGIVAKGVLPNQKGRPEHGLWMAKCKTAWWFEEIKRRYKETDNEEYRKQWKQLLEDNEREQGVNVEDE